VKLLRYGPAGEEKPGVLDAQGRIRDLSAVIPDLFPANLSPEGLERLAAIDPETLPSVAGAPRLGPPVAGIGQIHAIGLNYREHARESGMAIPEEPILFTKATSCLSGPDDDIVIPNGAQAVDWEVELGLVIGTAAYQISESQALDHVAGYLAANDVSERDFQARRGGQWVKGKSCPTFGPLGPWLVTRDEIPDPQNLALKLAVNGEIRQDGHSSDMIFPVARLISYVSFFLRLMPGDVIVTGTPAGVGMGQKPPVYLKPGDVVTLEVEGLGSQTQSGCARNPLCGRGVRVCAASDFRGRPTMTEPGNSVLRGLRDRLDAMASQDDIFAPAYGRRPMVLSRKSAASGELALSRAQAKTARTRSSGFVSVFSRLWMTGGMRSGLNDSFSFLPLPMRQHGSAGRKIAGGKPL
jgi:ureidoglycolate lyase